MEIKLTKNSENYIVKMRSDIMPEHIFRLQNLVLKTPIQNTIALNLENVDCFCFEFLDFLKISADKKRISLYNIPSELFAILSLTKYDKFTDIYLNNKDFTNKKRRLINRKFSVVQN